MNTFEYTSALQYRVKSQAQQIAEFKSGERYQKLEEKYKSTIRDLEKIIRELKQELTRAPVHIRFRPSSLTADWGLPQSTTNYHRTSEARETFP